MILFAAVLAFSGCGEDGSNGINGKDGEDLVNIAAGTTEVFTADGVAFYMIYVQGGIIFPIKTDDSGEAVVNSDYWIGETEVTYELWSAVYAWAVDNGYTFANAGVQGDGTDDTDQHPVTTVNWRDCMVWCNALTEWYNEKTGTDYTCVYTNGGSVVRDSQDSNGEICESVVQTSGTGFRLLSSKEWEQAARWKDDDVNTVAGFSNPWFTAGDSASGATADYTSAAANGFVAVYTANSGSSAAAVKSKLANALGLYDMSGNVSEWCFDAEYFGSARVIHGGHWFAPNTNLQVGYNYSDGSLYEWNSVGFRFARTD